MVSAINSISMGYYTMMANNSAYNMMAAANARTNLISSPMMMNNISFGSLAAMDTQYELDMITNSLQYKMARAMLEQLRKQQKEDIKRFSIFA